MPYDDGFHGTLPPYNGLVVLKSSALEDGGRDFLFSAAIDRQEVHLYDYELFDASVTTKIGLGKVDTNRDVSDPDKRDRISEEDARVKDFTLLDLNDDSFADLAVITSTPSNFLVIAQGDGAPDGFIIASNDPADDTAGRGGENSGIPLSEATPQGLGFPDTLVGILTTASDDGLGNDVAIVDYNRDDGHLVGFKEVTFTNFFTAVAGPVDGTSFDYTPARSNDPGIRYLSPGRSIHDARRVCIGGRRGEPPSKSPWALSPPHCRLQEHRSVSRSASSE